ncbi:RNA-binding protein [Vibrio sp. YMD68]|uniref:RNA recognition motif domain-containing protein n=1 Tax=Vibrio sp. YMD68 TaxID=3042300 RepID=UPI00249C55DB|nr:RNA-binding protein [Vibrio sp. YMD68]WGW00150.1 RNA-binding protein [Vibrio sp. YMD68]
MNSNKSILMVVAVAVIGSVILYLVDIPSIFAFLIGVCASALIFKPSNTGTETSETSSPSTQTLYVGNLPYKANEAHVRELFSKHGEVFAVRLMKDKRTGKRRGFGFVVVASSDVNSTIDALNDQDYMQRTLKVRVANDPKHPENEDIGQD